MTTSWVESPLILIIGIVALGMVVAALVLSPRRGVTRRRYREYRAFLVWTTVAVLVSIVLLAVRFVVLGAS